MPGDPSGGDVWVWVLPTPMMGELWDRPTTQPPLSPLPCSSRGKMNKMKNFKRRFSLSVPRTETIEESLTEFTEQFNQLNNQRNEGKGLGPGRMLPRCPGCFPHGGGGISNTLLLNVL